MSGEDWRIGWLEDRYEHGPPVDNREADLEADREAQALEETW